MSSPDRLLTDLSIGGNELWRILALGSTLVLTYVIGWLSRAVLLARARALHQRDRYIPSIAARSFARAVGAVAFAIGLKIGLHFLVLTGRASEMAQTASSVVVVIAVATVLYHLVAVADGWFGRMAARTPSKMDDMLVPIVHKTLRVTVVLLAILQIATLLSDKPLTSLLAGLGVGGLAIALAAQETVKNLFGSLVLFADKPFEVGDRIVVEAVDGAVEKVGLRSTKLRTLDGDLVTIPNGELANKFIRNVGRRPHLRRVVELGVAYDTSPDRLQRAVEILRELLANHEGAHADFPSRVYFKDFGESALKIEAVYWYHPADYWAYMAFNDRLNREILRRFNDEGIRFAFPTRTVHLAGNGLTTPAHA